MSDVQNQQQGGQQQAQNAVGGLTGQTQDLAGQATDRVGQAAGKAKNAVDGLVGGQEMDDYSYSNSDSETVVNDKTPKGLLGQLLNLDILPPPQSDTTTLESGDSADYYGPEGPQRAEAQG